MMLKKPKDIRISKEAVRVKNHKIPILILQPNQQTEKRAGVLWIHGGGYFLGMKEMVYMSRALELVRQFGVTVISPGYRLSLVKPYPAALQDCYSSLLYMKKHARRLGIRDDQIFVGGESAGGGLAVALCMLARDKGTVKIACQMPLYPMLDNYDTASSRNNHGRIWNTRRNHFGWRTYLRGNAKKEVSPYAAPAREKDFTGLPPAYTFAGNGEPFLEETKTYIKNLQKAGIPAKMDIYDMDMHAFDMLRPKLEISQIAAQKFNEHFAYAMEHYFAEQ